MDNSVVGCDVLLLIKTVRKHSSICSSHSYSRQVLAVSPAFCRSFSLLKPHTHCSGLDNPDVAN